MFSLKFVDRLAVVAMFSVIGAVPIAARACGIAVGARGEPASNGAHAVNDKTIQSIRAGLPASDLLALIGPPWHKERFEATRTTAWNYRYRDSWGYSATFSVIVDDADVVVGKFSARDGDG